MTYRRVVSILMKHPEHPETGRTETHTSTHTRLPSNGLKVKLLPNLTTRGGFEERNFRGRAVWSCLFSAYGSLKSFARKDGQDQAKVQSAKDEDPGNPTVNFHGEKRSNATHRSTTDPESVLYRKANGQASKLCFGTQVLMENRHGLCAAITVHNPIAQDEPTVALAQVDEHRELHDATITTLGGDKAYHQKKFVAGCRERTVAPHAACKDRVHVSGLDGRTTGRAGYGTSQRIRKRVEEIFGWMKMVGGLRRSRYCGVERTQAWAYFVAGTYNLLRITNLGLSLQAG